MPCKYISACQRVPECKVERGRDKAHVAGAQAAEGDFQKHAAYNNVAWGRVAWVCGQAAGGDFQEHAAYNNVACHGRDKAHVAWVCGQAAEGDFQKHAAQDHVALSPCGMRSCSRR
eukprot:1162036-Pelagomonas_calceolata.AAC.16